MVQFQTENGKIAHRPVTPMPVHIGLSIPEENVVVDQEYIEDVLAAKAKKESPV